MRTAMQWGHDGTPKHNGAIMRWDPIVRYGDCHAVGTQWDPKVQWGHDGMGPIVHYGDCHAVGTQWDPTVQWGHNGMGSYRALWGLPCNGDMMGPQNTMGP